LIVHRLEEFENTDRDISGPHFRSVRLLLQRDGVGFSFHITRTRAGSVGRWHYKNHIEAVYCIAGHAEVTEVTTGLAHDITPGTLYVLNNHDKHIVSVLEDVTFACVFTPACVGSETHDADGSYPLLLPE
jgi:L-ectoine synthase